MVAFFQKITDVLNKSNIPYMLSGSVAMSIYIVPRSTRDLDFIVHLEPENITSFVEGFHGDYYCDKESVEDAVKRRSMFNIIDHASGFKADFVVLKNEDFRQEEFSRRKKVDFLGKPIYIVSPEDLLISKLIWIQDYQSSQQMEDIKNLAAVENLDWPYIKKWIDRLRLNLFNLVKE